MMSKYIRQIDDLERRLEIATRYRCFGVGIEVSLVDANGCRHNVYIHVCEV